MYLHSVLKFLNLCFSICRYAQYALVEFIESHRELFLPRKRTVPLPQTYGKRKSVACDKDHKGDWASFASDFAYGRAENGFEELLDVHLRPICYCSAGGRSSFLKRLKRPVLRVARGRRAN